MRPCSIPSGSAKRAAIAAVALISVSASRLGHLGGVFEPSARGDDRTSAATPVITGTPVQGSSDTTRTLLKQQKWVWKRDVESSPGQRYAKRGEPSQAAPATTPRARTTEKLWPEYTYPIPPDAPDVGQNRDTPGAPNTETPASGNNYGSVGAPLPIAP